MIKQGSIFKIEKKINIFELIKNLNNLMIKKKLKKSNSKY